MIARDSRSEDGEPSDHPIAWTRGVRSPTGLDETTIQYESTHDPIDVVVDTSNDTNTITVGSCRGDQGRRYRASTVPPKRR